MEGTLSLKNDYEFVISLKAYISTNDCIKWHLDKYEYELFLYFIKKIQINQFGGR